MLGEFETRCGRVERLRAHEAVVKLERGKLNPACATCGACGATPPQGVRIRVRTGDEQLRIGDTVMVRYYVPNAAVVSAIVFGLPVAGLMAGMVAVAIGTPRSMDSPLAVVSSLCGLAFGGATAWLIERRFLRTHPATIVEKRPPTAQTR